MKDKLALDPNILKNYAVATTVLFVGLATYYLIGLNSANFSNAVHLMTVKAFSMTLLILVLISAIVGMAFHHLVSTEYRSRNTFAFIFALGAVKVVGSLLLFNLLW